VAKQVLAEKGIAIGAHIKSIGAVADEGFALNNIDSALLARLSASSFSLIAPDKEEAMRAEVEKYRLDENSVGGEIECAVTGVPAGYGGNMFDTVEGKRSALLFGIPAVKGVQFGLGFGFAESHGAAVNDAYAVEDGQVKLLSNHNGGVLGGITSGAPIVFSVCIKPTPSIAKAQQSVNLDTMENTVLEIKGRHDPCIVPRAVPVVEAVAALGILDILTK